MAYSPLTQKFLEGIDRYNKPQAVWHKSGGSWQPISSAEMLRRVAGLSRALAALGVGRGDRVGLFSPNRPEWHIADFAILGLGAVSVPIYFNEAPERITYILNDSGAKLAIAAGVAQAERLLDCREQLKTVEHIIVAGAPQRAGAEVLCLETLVGDAGPQEVAEYRRRAATASIDGLATIIYTSGTTGEPKGVMLTHSNLSSNATDALPDQDWGPKDLMLSWLPLSHVYERIMGYGAWFAGVGIAYLERIEDVPSAMLEVRPTLLAAVPRFFEKFYARVIETGHNNTGIRRALFDWALRVADRAVPWRAYDKPAPLGLRLAWQVADQLVYRRIRAGLGGRVRSFTSGSAPLAKELLEFFWAVDVRIYQGYGLTETSPVVSSNRPGANKVGTVGQPIPRVEVRIAADGEILVRGPCVMQGYYHKPDQTREALPQDGWLHTGDIGALDEDGYLSITDRKKELLKTAGGKLIAPQPIENRLRTSPFILNAAVVGDRHKFVAALIVPNFDNVAGKGRAAGLAFQSNAELCAHPWVHELIAAEIERLTTNLAQYEKIKRFALLEQDFTIDGGELSATMKLKRRIIERRYANRIEQLYADVEEPRPGSHPPPSPTTG